MKPFAFRFLGGATILLVASCSNVTVKKPAGDAIPELKKDLWTGTWQGPESFRGVSRIKDAKAGIIELKSLEKDENGREEEPLLLAVRELGNRQVITAMDTKNPKEPGPFFRAVVTDEFAAFFPVREDLIRKAVRDKSISGREVKRNPAGGDQESKAVEIDQFGRGEAAKLLPAGTDDTAFCFEADPAYVLIREKPQP